MRTEADHAAQWAMTQINLGIVHAELPAGDRAANLAKAIACFEAALRVQAEGEYLTQWATTQDALGAAYAELPSGDRAANLRKAITCYEAALGVHTEAASPVEWSGTQANLALALEQLADLTDDVSLAGRAADCFTAAQRGFTASGLLEQAEQMRRCADEARKMF